MNETSTLGVADSGEQVVNRTAPLALPGDSQSFFDNNKTLVLVAIVVLLAIIVRLFRRKKAPRRNTVFVVGQRGAGKTQLVYALAKGVKAETVPSIKNNATTFKLDQGNPTNIVDVAGANHTKEEFVQNVGQALAIVQVVDGADQDSISGAAQLLYKLLISSIYQKNQPAHCILLNKQDLPGFIGQKMFQKRLEDQMERIKLSRKTMVDERQGQDDIVKGDKSRFNLGSYPIRILTGSVSAENLEQLNSFLAEI